MEPKHSFTQKSRDPARYLGRRLPAGTDVWEFKTNQFRALFITQLATRKDRKKITLVAFLPVKGNRFYNVKDCPWHR